MVIHLETLFTHDTRLRLQFVNEPWANKTNYESAPRFVLGRTREGNIWRFRSDLPMTLIDQLENLCHNEPITADLNQPPTYLNTYIQLLEAHQPIQRVWHGPAYQITSPQAISSKTCVHITTNNTHILGTGFEKMQAELETAQPFFAIVQQGHAVSICRSVRISSQAHEAGIETLNTYQRQGYATAALAKWANAVRKMGYFPLYSTSWENKLSQKLAQKSGAVRYGDDFHIT